MRTPNQIAASRTNGAPAPHSIANRNPHPPAVGETGGAAPLYFFSCRTNPTTR